MELITVSRKGGMAFDVSVGRHHLTCDMAPEDGGAGAGLSPVEMFAGSLGACIAMMVQCYCETCGCDGDVGVSLALELLPKPKRIGAVVVDVELPRGVSEDRRDAIRRVVRECVIHETLRHPPDVDVEILTDSELRPDPEPVGAGTLELRRN
ncbi:MAG: OsmC family protein [Gemmatimonadetes bacterium]|nr:OsmC family protein [Gemmatimonadota bacterium]